MVPTVVQECKALNGRLINFLKERSTVEKLLQYLIQAPPEDDEAADPKQQFKYSFAACEVRTMTGFTLDPFLHVNMHYTFII